LLTELLSLLAQTTDLLLLLGDVMFDRSDLTSELGKFVSQVSVSPLEGPDPRLCLLNLSLSILEISSQLACTWAVVSTATSVSEGLLELVDFAGQSLNSLTSLAACSDLAAWDTGPWGDTDWLASAGTWSLDWSWGFWSAWAWASWFWSTSATTAVAVTV